MKLVASTVETCKIFNMNNLYKALLLFGAALLLFSCTTKPKAKPEVEVSTLHLEFEISESHRGACLVGDSSAWFAGTNASVLFANASGKLLEVGPPKNLYKNFEFRDVHAFSDSEAVVMAIGSPALFLYTNNQGKQWDTAFYDTTSARFFDAIDFLGSTGFGFSDAQNAQIPIVVSENSGKSWEYLPQENWPKINGDYGGFAASGSVIKVLDKNSFIIALGGPKATLLATFNRGASWQEIQTPIQSGSESQGIFSIDFWPDSTLIVAGGDYLADSTSGVSLAISKNLGVNWQVLDSNQYYSSVQLLGPTEIITASRFNNAGMHVYENMKQFHNAKCYVSLCNEAENMVWCSGKNKIWLYSYHR